MAASRGNLFQCVPTLNRINTCLPTPNLYLPSSFRITHHLQKTRFPPFSAAQSHLRKVKAPISFPRALSMPPSLERDPRCLSSLPTKSRLVAPLSHCQSNQVTKFPVSDLQAY